MPKPAALYFWCAMSFIFYLTSQLQSLYSEKRPYWVTDDIASEMCLVGFGNPSEHLFNNVFFWLTVYLHAYHEVGVKQPRMAVFCTAYIIKMAATCIGVTFLIFMGFSRVYLGAHAINQVIFGVLLAITFALVGHYKVKPIFLDMPEYLYSDMEGSKYQVTLMSYVKSMIFGLVLPMILASLVLLMKVDMAFYHSNTWNYRHTNAGCSTDELKDSHITYYFHL